MKRSTLVARPSIGDPGNIWVEIRRQPWDSFAGSLNIEEALDLAGRLLLAVEEMSEEALR